MRNGYEPADVPEKRRHVLTRHYVYPLCASVRAGETLDLCVRTAALRARLAATRAGSLVAPAFESAFFSARDAESQTVPLRVPADARPGVYLAYCVADGESRADVCDVRSGAALFVVRPRRATARTVLNLPLFTYHAYNTGDADPFERETTGLSLYTGAKRVTLHRPGGGVGGHLWDEKNVDWYDRSSPRQSFAHWDARALRWLERDGHDVECVTDYDLHADRSLLEGRTLLLCFGHHEYWTDAMRARAETFVAAGGNVAFFGANALWFRTRFDPDAMTIGRDGAWPVGEEAFTGASYRFGGGKWIGERPAIGYTVAEPEHWAFAGCGFARGSTFGTTQRLIGYECDGVDDSNRDASASEIARAELRWNVADGSGEVFPRGHASFVVRSGRGTVVHAGTVDWPRLLDVDASVTRITRNIIGRLASGPIAA